MDHSVAKTTKETISKPETQKTMKLWRHVVPPDIVYDDTSGDLSIAEGENATLWCKATGHPPPRIAWKREDGQPIILRKNVRDIVKGESGSILCSVRVFPTTPYPRTSH
ncbi:hypothetical protein Trydic_g6177 [Trypoxylus dichotomus]